MHYTFQASGSLWQDALVMQDLQTKSLWSQISGECIQGPMEGEKLTILPASHTNYSQYSKDYPNGLLLKKPEKGEQGSHYEKYFADSTKMGIFGRVDSFERLGAKDKVFGIIYNNQQAAVSVSLMEQQNLVLLNNFSPAIIVTYDKKSKSVSAFSLTGIEPAETKKLSLIYSKITTPDGSLSFDARTGRSLKGESKALEPVPVVTSFWFAWASFFPETELKK